MNAVLVIGAGRTGQACAEILGARGVRVFVTDEEAPKKLERAIATIRSAGAEFVPAQQVQALLPEVHRAVLSPGVPLQGAFAQRIAASVPVVSEIELAYELSKAPIIAVTGTKGKSTTTALIAHLLRCAGNSVRVGGNIGNPLVREASAATSGDWLVAEVSSFQLETIRAFKPRIAVLLNISDDHLDRYPSLEDYARAKYRVFENQDADDVFVGNRDDTRAAGAAQTIRAKQLWFTMRSPASDAAAFVRDQALWYRPLKAPPERIIDRSDIALPGEHNLQNVLAAMLVAVASGATPQSIRESIPSFEPMEHRLETIGEIGGVRYVDDSKATNPAAVIAALSAFKSPIVLIAGGKSKGADLSELGQMIRKRVKALILLGESADTLARASSPTPSTCASTIEEAVQLARERAVADDVVLLSPAAASFDMFASAEERGDRFAAAVRNLEREGMRETADA